MAGAVLQAGVVAVTGALAIGLVSVGTAATEAQRLQGVADGAALAAADALAGFAAGEPCARSRRLAAAQGTHLATCVIDERVATIEVRGAFAGIPVSASARAGPPPAGAGSDGDVNDLGWARPSAGIVTDAYGWRIHPIHGDRRLHQGVDFSSGCDAPIWAAASGTVTDAGFGTRYGGNGAIVIDHGSGVQTVYLHMHASGIFVNAGDDVVSGQQIGAEGSSGDSTGCHLHFESHVDGVPVDPAAFLAEVGVALGG